MSRFSRVLAACGLALLLGTLEAPEVQAQGAIGFQPVITPFPDGVSLGVTPVVTADRRYVRLGLNPAFNTVRGVDVFNFGAGAVAGGGVGGGFGLGGGGFGGGGGFNNIGPGQFGAAQGAATVNGKITLPTVRQFGVGVPTVNRFGQPIFGGYPYGVNPYGPLGFGYGSGYGVDPTFGYNPNYLGYPYTGIGAGYPYGSFGNRNINGFNRNFYRYRPPVNAVGPFSNSIRQAVAPGTWRYGPR